MIDDDKARNRWAILIFFVVLGVVTGLIAWNAWHRAAEPYPLAKPRPMTAEEAARYRSLRVNEDPGAKPPNVQDKGEEEVPKGR